MLKKRILILTYYWPPSGGAGVQRWLKFVKYLRDYGYEPIIYKPLNPEYPVFDDSLQADIPKGIEVIERKIWEPYSAYKTFIGQKKDEKINTGFLTESSKPKKTEKLSVWLRGNLFIPDARKYWIKPSYRFLKSYLKDNPVEAIISTGPPHSMHMIALKLKKKLGIPWLADFRDPWTNIDFYDELMLTKLADKKHRKLEHSVLSSADVVTTVGPTMSEEFVSLGVTRVETITNGYDTLDDLSIAPQLSSKFSLAHIGSLVKSRNPKSLWTVLKKLCDANSEFRKDLEILLIGKVDINVLNSLKAFDLDLSVNRIDYVPHSEVVLKQREAQVLLLLSNDTPNAKGILTGKFFEYLSAGRPILTIGAPDGDLAKILNETKSGTIHDFNDIDSLEIEVIRLYKQYKKGELSTSPEGITQYSRKELTRKLAQILDSIVKV